MTCPTTMWTAASAWADLTTDGLTVITAVEYDSLFFLVFFTASNGAVTGSRYKSNTNVISAGLFGITSDYLVMTTASPISLLIYSFSSGLFTIMGSSNTLNNAAYDPTLGK